MKKILFKAKSIATGEWVEGSLIDSGNHEQVFIYPHFDGASTMSCRSLVYHRMIAVDPDTICQYTGLTDKNGNKIWENDIVDIQHYAEKEHKVKWGYGGFYVGINGLLCHYNTVCEVIGNTFDNACIDELLADKE